MTRDQLLAAVEPLRAREPVGTPTPEELAAYPAAQSLFYVPADDGHPIPVYRITPQTMPEHPDRVPLVINFHGGGFIRGWDIRSGFFCRKLALAHQCVVWDVDYRVAPEAPFPTAVLESYRVAAYAFEHARELGIDPARIILAGHSAGANLAATVCMRAGETRAFRPAGLIMDYPPLDVYTDPASKPREEGDSAPEDANIYNASYCQKGEGKNPYASPVFAELSMLKHFPETLMITCQLDKLCREGERFASMLVEAGITVTCRRFVNSLHGFTVSRTDEWQGAMELIHRFIRQRLEPI